MVIDSIKVTEAYRKKGIGTKLTWSLIDHLANKWVSQIRVRQGLADDFFTRFGFEFELGIVGQTFLRKNLL